MGEQVIHGGDVVTLHIKCLVRYGVAAVVQSTAPKGYEDGEDSSGDEFDREEALTEAAAKQKKKHMEENLERVTAYAPRFPEVRHTRLWQQAQRRGLRWSMGEDERRGRS